MPQPKKISADEVQAAKNIDSNLAKLDVELLIKTAFPDPEKHVSKGYGKIIIGTLLTVAVEVEHQLKLLDPDASLADPNLSDALLRQAAKNAIVTLKDFHKDLGDLIQDSDEHQVPEEPSPITTTAVMVSRVPFALDKVTETFLKHNEPPTVNIKGMVIKTFDGQPAEGKQPSIPPAFVDLTYQLDQEIINSIYGEGYSIQTGRISYFDWKIVLAMDAIAEEKKKRGIPVYMSLSEIHKNMTASKNRPQKKQLERIRAGIERMMVTRIKIDTTREQHLERHSRTVTGTFLPCEIIEENGFINNMPAALVHPYRVEKNDRIAPMLKFAIERGQFSTLDSRLFNKSPLPLTDENIEIEYYLLKRVLKMKHSRKTPRTILISTLISECCRAVIPKSDDQNLMRMQKAQWARRKRTKNNALLLLDHLKTEKFIKGYKEVDDKILITL